MKFKKTFKEILELVFGTFLVWGTAIILVQLPGFLFADLIERVTLMMGLMTFGSSTMLIYLLALHILDFEEDELDECDQQVSQNSRADKDKSPSYPPAKRNYEPGT